MLLSERLKNVAPVSAHGRRLRRGPIILLVLHGRPVAVEVSVIWQTHSKTPCFKVEADKLMVKRRHNYIAARGN